MNKLNVIRSDWSGGSVVLWAFGPAPALGATKTLTETEIILRAPKEVIGKQPVNTYNHLRNNINLQGSNNNSIPQVTNLVKNRYKICPT